MPNRTLTALASNTAIQTLSDLETKLDPPWMLANIHGGEILELLARLDQGDRDTKERLKQTKQAESQRKKQEQEQVRDEKRRRRAEEKAEKDRLKALELAERETRRAQAKAMREAADLEKQRKRDLKAQSALRGSGVFNAGAPRDSTANSVSVYPTLHRLCAIKLIIFCSPLN